MNNYTVAAAVALALGTATAAHSQSCPTATYTLYVAGSSAAKPAFQAALGTDLFASQTSYSSSNGDFEAFCGPLSQNGANNTGLTAGNITTVYYRAEGGSVVGALPIVSGNPVKFLDFAGSGCGSPTGGNGTTGTPYVISTSGTSATNGTADSWGGCVTTHGVELGVTDLEPSVFYSSGVVKNYPTAYNPSVFGTASQSQLATLASGAYPLFQQVFGIFVNQGNFSAPTSTLNLSKETVAQILTGNYSDWSKVPSASGAPVSSGSAGITVVNREPGSGTRTGATLYFLEQECSSYALKLKDPASATDYYSTQDVLTQANSTPGAITYASIDNASKTYASNLTLVQLSGVTPSNLNAATGQYDFWFEATAIQGTVTSNGGQAISDFLVTASDSGTHPNAELAALATAPHAVDILAIPGVAGNTAGVPLTSSAGAHTIYINPFTRGGHSCAIPNELN
jgi:ABC-type phosphate transport system substrate-binding protein